MLRNLLMVCACLLLMGGATPGGTVAWRQAIETSERLQDVGKLREAEQVLLEILKDESRLHADGLAYIYNNLGSVCQDQRRFADANRHYRRSIAEWERAGDRHRMELARTLNNLASLLWDARKRAEAERVLIRSADIQIAAIGTSHPEAAQLFYNLGTLHLNQNRWTEAGAAYRQFLAVPGHLANDPLKTAVAASNLGVICRKTGRHAEADDLFQRARMIWEQSRNVLDLAPMLLLDLATSFWSGSLPVEAESAGRQALAAAEFRFGPTHPRTAQTLTLYAAILRRTHRKAEARAMEKRASEIEAGDAQMRLSRQTIDVNELKPRGTWNPNSNKPRS
ncbi:MAG: tetratricopeptide repeat protein [Acidobacteria bacterium]|nr:tetratricopeptide repeat protein [Acidobacteriota bacterium]